VEFFNFKDNILERLYPEAIKKRINESKENISIIKIQNLDKKALI
jgi:hypothetical protein